MVVVVIVGAGVGSVATGPPVPGGVGSVAIGPPVLGIIADEF